MREINITENLNGNITISLYNKDTKILETLKINKDECKELTIKLMTFELDHKKTLSVSK